MAAIQTSEPRVLVPVLSRMDAKRKVVEGLLSYAQLMGNDEDPQVQIEASKMEIRFMQELEQLRKPEGPSAGS